MLTIQREYLRAKAQQAAADKKLVVLTPEEQLALLDELDRMRGLVFELLRHGHDFVKRIQEHDESYCIGTYPLDDQIEKVEKPFLREWILEGLAKHGKRTAEQLAKDMPTGPCVTDVSLACWALCNDEQLIDCQSLNGTNVEPVWFLVGKKA